MRCPSFISRHNAVQKVGGILNRHGHFKHTLRAQRCRDCGRWTLSCHTVPISHSSTAISGKIISLPFLLDLYLYFPNISRKLLFGRNVQNSVFSPIFAGTVPCKEGFSFQCRISEIIKHFHCLEGSFFRVALRCLNSTEPVVSVGGLCDNGVGPASDGLAGITQVTHCRLFSILIKVFLFTSLKARSQEPSWKIGDFSELFCGHDLCPGQHAARMSLNFPLPELNCIILLSTDDLMGKGNDMWTGQFPCDGQWNAFTIITSVAGSNCSWT
jgi:hypothetical protein